MGTLTAEYLAPVRCRKVVDGGDFVTVRLWARHPEAEMPDDLAQAVREAEADACRARTQLQAWQADLEAVRSFHRRLQRAREALGRTVRHGPAWAAAAAAFALQRVKADLESAAGALPWLEQRVKEAEQAAREASQHERELRARAESATVIRWRDGRTYTVRFRRDNGRGLVPVHADRPDAVAAARAAVEAYLAARSHRPRGEEDALAAEIELRSLAEPPQPPAPGEPDEFDSFGPDWHWEEELRRREAADKLLSSRQHSLDGLQAPVLVLLQRDCALHGRAWELARAWLEDVVSRLVSRGILEFRIPGTAKGREAAEIVRRAGGKPAVFALLGGDDDSVTAAYLAAMRTARSMLLVAGSAHAGGTPLYLLDPALAAAAAAAPLVRLDASGRTVCEPDLPLPWVRFDLAAALASCG